MISHSELKILKNDPIFLKKIELYLGNEQKATTADQDFS